MTIRKYSSPEAFKQALEQRLRTYAKSGAAFARKRQLLVFDRLLARVVAVLGDAATLKGGLVLELRIEHARTTKDVDLRMVGSPDDILTRLQPERLGGIPRRDRWSTPRDSDPGRAASRLSQSGVGATGDAEGSEYVASGRTK